MTSSSGPGRLRVALRSRPLRRLLIGILLADLAEHGGWLAVLLFAYESGGVGEAGIVAPALLVPTIVLAPLIGAAVDRHNKARVLAAAVGLGAVALGTAAALAYGSAPRSLVYGAAGVFSVTIAARRPAVVAITPWLSRTIDELTGVTVVIGWVESAARLLGPAIATLVLLEGSPEAVMTVLGSGALIGALVLARGIDADGSLESADDPVSDSWRNEVRRGLQLLAGRPDTRAAVVSIVAISTLAGALDVAAAAIAIELLGATDALVGLMISAHGAGFLIGATSSAVAVGGRRTGAIVCIGVAISGLAFAGLGLTSATATAIALVILLGLFGALVSVASRTVLQVIAPYEAIGRLFSIVESGSAIGLAIGGLSVAAIAVGLGLERALLAVGAAVTLLAPLVWPALRAVDRRRRDVDQDLLLALRSSPIFAPQPLLDLEGIASLFRVEDVPAASRIMSTGDPGTEMAVVCEGTVLIRRGDVEATVGRGAHLGEVAALYGQTRNADIDAGVDGARLAWIEVDTMLNLFAGSTPRSFQRLVAESRRRGVDPGTEIQSGTRPVD